MPQQYQPSNIGWDIVDTPNPLECGMIVTSEITGLTPALLAACIGQPVAEIMAHLRQPPPQEFASMVVTHYRFFMHLRGTLTFYCAAAKTPAQRITPFNSYPIKDQSDWAAIVNGFVWYENDSLPLSSTKTDGSTANVDRILGKPDYVPPFSGPGVYMFNEYLSEVPFPALLADADDAPVLTAPRWDWVQLAADFGPCYHPRLEVPVPDPQNWKEIARTGEPSGSDISSSSQVFKATNHRTWQEYQWKFDVKRTDDDKGQYYARELVKVPPMLKERVRP